MIPIQCTTCGGLSQIDRAWLGQQVQCPHCHKPTAATAANLEAPPVQAPPPPPAPTQPPPFPSEPRGSSPRSDPPPHIEVPIVESTKIAPAAKPEPQPKRPPLTRSEREAVRQRRHLILALTGGVILLVVAYLLMFLNNTPID